MITIDSVLSKKNLRIAFDHLYAKSGQNSPSGDKQSELQLFWSQNGERISEQIRACIYTLGLINEYEIVNGKGKRRLVTTFTDTDKLITRLLAQKLNQFYGPTFLPNSCAYQENKGIVTATDIAREYIEVGNEYVVDTDIQSFFDEISIERLYGILQEDIKDKAVLALIRSYLYCSVANDGVVRKVEKGILQGSPMSPVLSNLYLRSLDRYFESRGYLWVRFADDINIYTDSEQKGEEIYEDVIRQLKNECLLSVNRQKSGVFDAYERRFLGFDFIKKGKRVIVSRHVYEKRGINRDWHPCVVEKVNKEYHIVKNGTLNKKDYALLFENPDEKHHIPVEATEQINLYNEVLFSSSVLRTLAYERIRLGIYDRHGELLGYFTPQGYNKDAKVLIGQCLEYSDDSKRLKIAKAMEIAAIHNIRANIRYYIKKKHSNLESTEKVLTEGIKQLNECKSVEQLLLAEARCRQQYYQAFNSILCNKDFAFEKRTKRPPEDAINALVSFGNTVLYNRIQQMIWHTQLDSRIGIFHAANKRNCSLNLDFADVFKPLTVDRAIFTIINRGQIRASDFTSGKDEKSVYLDDAGKRLFIEAFNEKMASKLTVKGKMVSYEQLIEGEIFKYQDHIRNDTKYAPYKYY